MVLVSYDHDFNYLFSPNQRAYPGLVLRVGTPGTPEQALETDAYLDSGAERSLFDGRIATAIGLDLLNGRRLLYQPTAGQQVEGRLHRVRLSHPDLGIFEIEVGFSTQPITRNLLGRDFFNLIQVGFRERHLAFYLTPAP